MQDYTITDVGVDYLTATSKTAEVGELWYEKFLEYSNERANKLEPIMDWSNRWYSGRVCQKVYWGASQTMGYIIMAQGGPAKELWLKLVPSSAYSVTRIDLQVTCLLRTAKPEWAEVLYNRAKDIKGRTSTMVVNSRGGSTTYIGSRQSDQFGRVYDRGVKAKTHDSGMLWRYEVQVMKPRAHPLTESLYQVLRSHKNSQVEEIQGFVYRWFNARSVSTLFTEKPSTIVAEVGKSVTTKDRKITWLRTQVQPTVRNLIAAGHLKDTIDALGVTYDQLSLLANAEGVLVTEESDPSLTSGSIRDTL